MDRWEAPGVPAPLLTLARTARGETQADVAKRAGISQGLLSKAESGLVDLDLERLERLAEALAVPISLLTHRTEESDSLVACVFHRKRSTLPVSKAKQIRALLDLTRLQIERLLDAETPPLTLPRLAPTSDGYTTPADIARMVRQELRVSHGPLADLVGAVESAGVLVVRRDLGSRRIDAIAGWPAKGRPIFLLNTEAPADRRRFTMAHELGHAVMHETPAEGREEEEADRFASELLMPAGVIAPELVNLTVPRLVELKDRWRVSMAALVRRGRDLGTITDYQYKQLNIEFSKAGYRTREPTTIEDEVPRLVKDVIARRRARGETEDQMASDALLSTSELIRLYLKEAS
jgi:Zn-dependent peptidase ImmA (M78 family)/transcriptional regulator with XRE-family HTH domain